MNNNNERLNEKLINVIRDKDVQDRGRLKKIMYLYKLGADVNAKLYGKSALSWAIEKKDEEVVSFLKNMGAKEWKISKEEANMLGRELFSKNGDLSEIEKLLKKGADVNIRDDEENTLLIDAVLKEDEKEILFWVEKGVNINATNKEGRTPLMISMACIGGDNIAKLLIDLNADMELKDKYGQTALMLGAFFDNIKAVELLIEKGADVHQKDKFGETALSMAKFIGKDNIVKLLVEKEGVGKKENKYGYGFLGNSKVK